MLQLYLALLALGCIALLLHKFRKPARFPPGPPRLPFVGSIPYLTDPGPGNPQLRINDRMMRKYGKIWGCYVGNTPMVTISDYNIAKKLLSSDVTSDRPNDSVPSSQFRPGFKPGKGIGVVFSNGQHWKEQRRFALRNLRDLGFGKSSMEDSINEEVEKFNKAIKRQEGTPVDLTLAFNAAILNALWDIMMGSKMELDDPKLQQALSDLNEFFRSPFFVSKMGAVLPSPSWANLPGLRTYMKMDVMKKSTESLTSIVREYIKQHEDTFDIDSEPRDFMDMYLSKIKTEKDPNSTMFGQEGQDNLVNVFSDLFVAGSETTSSSLVWAIFYMVHHPDVQARVHAEIDSVLEHDTSVSLQDQESLPYTNAVLQEAFRLTGFATASVPHATAKDVDFEGFHIPKGTILNTSLFEIMRDPEHFSEPDVFNPDRFISPEGKFIKDEHVCPFGVGKRYCLGQSLAEKEYFLFFVGVMRRFQFRPVPGLMLPGYNIDEVVFHGPARNPPEELRVLAIDRQVPNAA